MDLQKVLNAETEKLMASGTIEEMVKKNLEKCVADLVSEQFRRGSPIKKSLEKSLEGALNIDLSEVDLSSMFTFVTDHAKSKLHQIISNEANSKYLEEVDKILKPLPEEMTLESFAEQIIKFWHDDSYEDKDDWSDCATIDLESHDWGGKTIKIYIEESRTYSSSTSKAKEVHIFLGEKEEEGYHTVKISHKQNYNPTCLREEEAFIFKAYTQQVKLTGFDTFDSDNIETYVKQDDCY